MSKIKAPKKDISIRDLPAEEFLEISRALEPHHSIFYRMWSLGKPKLTTNPEIETGYIQFDRSGKEMEVCFSEKFWSNLDLENKAFFLSHEYLHAILNHGTRSPSIENADIANIAEDIVINHTLVNCFGFKREKIYRGKDWCWIDTVFNEEDQKNILSAQNFEYYYQKLLSSGDSINGKSLCDDHGMRLSQEDLEALGETLGEIASPDEINSLLERLGIGIQNEKNYKNSRFGSAAGNLTILVPIDPKKVIKKKKWETIIKDWSIKKIKINDRDEEQWLRLNRRLTFVDLGSDFFLPSEMELEEIEFEKNKVHVLMFLDTSGSCYHLGNRFFKAAASLPPDRFELSLYCFDTRVYKTDLKSRKLYGFGGTSFVPIKEEVEKYAKKNKKFPDGIFIITDGDAEHIYSVTMPARWHWLLTDGGSRSSIPPECNKYNLREFE